MTGNLIDDILAKNLLIGRTCNSCWNYPRGGHQSHVYCGEHYERLHVFNTCEKWYSMAEGEEERLKRKRAMQAALEAAAGTDQYKALQEALKRLL